MKRTIFFTPIIAFVFILCSCEREGVYAPEKRISSITHDENGYYKEVWVWDKDLLREIYFQNSNVSYRFYYNKKQLTAIHVFAQTNMYYQFTYDKQGKRLLSMDSYLSQNDNMSARLFERTDFTYNDDGLINGFETKHYWGKYKNCDQERHTQYILQLLFPIIPNTSPEFKHKGSGDYYSTTASFNYKDGNITDGLYIETFDTCYIHYSYTQIPNPFREFFHYAYLDPTVVNQSAHNSTMILHATLEHHCHPQFSANYSEDFDFSYETDKDGYPIKITRSMTISSENYPIIDGGTQTYSIEYEQ
ncbi:MAG: hypothetical protein IKZ56_12810 [Bacteroidales bacterium]|nr:hypothetical protein [Bacteroidales bacterium]MBR5922031.1 hypothetical protein [Bacteroidales bacterium]